MDENRRPTARESSGKPLSYIRFHVGPWKVTSSWPKVLFCKASGGDVQVLFESPWFFRNPIFQGQTDRFCWTRTSTAEASEENVTSQCLMNQNSKIAACLRNFGVGIGSSSTRSMRGLVLVVQQAGLMLSSRNTGSQRKATINRSISVVLMFLGSSKLP